MCVLDSCDHFSHSVSPSFLSQRVVMSSSNSIGTRRMTKLYKEITDKDDDPHFLLSIRVSDTFVETNRSSYQIQVSIVNDEVAPARVAPLSCHFALDASCDKGTSCLFPQKRLPWKLSLSDIYGYTICVCADFFWLTNSLTHSLHCTGGKKSQSPTFGLSRQKSPKMSVVSGHPDLHYFHFGLCEAPQPPIVARVSLHLWCTDVNHGYFRRLFKPLSETGSDIL